MQRDGIDALKRLLPPHMHARAYVAGGYAHNPELAGDIDLWVVNATAVDEREILDYLRDRKVIPVFGSIQQADFPMYGDSQHMFTVVKTLGSKQAGTPKMTQILTTPSETIYDLLDYFDISTHKVAVGLVESDVMIVGAGGSVAPRVTRWDTPSATWERLEKIAKRYGFEPHPDDVEKLELLIADPEEWKEVA